MNVSLLNLLGSSVVSFSSVWNPRLVEFLPSFAVSNTLVSATNINWRRNISIHAQAIKKVGKKYLVLTGNMMCHVMIDTMK